MTTTTPRLGADFARLWTTSALTNTADGIMIAAGPLLVSRLTDDPAAIGAVAFVGQLPWLLFSLVSGVLVDRWNRRRVVVAVNVYRAVVIGGLALAVATGNASVWLVYLAFFLVGVGETLVDNAAGALVPDIVAVELLPSANARQQGVSIVANMFVAPPLGAALFVVAAALPFSLEAALFALGALVAATLRHRPPPRPVERRSRMRDEIVEGLRWAWSHKLLRSMAVSLCLMNIALMATIAILVLYAQQRLGLDEFGFGLLFAAVAAGGLLGSALAPWLQWRVGDSLLVRVGLLIETATHFGLATTTDPWVAGGINFLFGVHGAVLGVVLTSVRHRAVPEHLRGRVGSVYSLLVIGGSAIGSLIGGFVARGFGVTAPFWAAGVAMVVLTAVVWRGFRPAAFAAEAGHP
ncbi:MFS transporter [Actinokineospora globicatena]|uniref:MFS transporter n=1 Tax=Actinokineospora globicatena TaxID=103729 RepID=UPI0020A23D7C|nr:MFS transporter [Actinokineospora globicatena]MCP2304345.1 Transmembrane secretion effector [Actinokineospora globicatena]GLW78291.1 MFS transporter [Actinokineospora globicatena]GLW85045.1 MFS transporter [Actinokineospora globicatena]